MRRRVRLPLNPFRAAWILLQVARGLRRIRPPVNPFRAAWFQVRVELGLYPWFHAPKNHQITMTHRAPEAAPATANAANHTFTL